MTNVDKLKPSASMEVTRLANQLKALGHKVFPLSIGDTHFRPPQVIVSQLQQAIELSQTHYTDANGLTKLRKNIADSYHPFFEQKEVLITPGVKQGLYYFFLASQFKKICVLEPAWLGYEATAVLTNKEYIAVNIKEQDWLNQLSQADFDALLLCSPNNPDGKIFSIAELTVIKAIVEKKGALLLIDEIYKVYTYDRQKRDLLRIFYGKEYVTIFNGFSKSHAITGLRIGFMLTKDQKLFTDCANLHQNIATCSNSIGQFASIDFQAAMSDVKAFVDYYEANCQLVSEIIPEFLPYKPTGGFYYFIDLSQWGVADSQDFCQKLLEKEMIALVPGDAYGKGFESWVRLSFSVDREVLREALYKFKNYLSHHIS